jgi:Ca2+-binding RTX toxin-like protein
MSIFTGTPGNDFLVGTPGDDSISGLAGDDTLNGGLGADTLDGGAGVDTASYSGAPSAVTVSLAVAGPQDTGGAGVDTLIGIENLDGSAFADVLIGDAGNNRLFGGDGEDTLSGGPGDDTLIGDLDNGDHFPQLDTADYSTAPAGVIVDLTILGPQDTRAAGRDTLISIEGLIGSNFNDYLATTGLNGHLQGGGGDDILRGNIANDILDGGSGIDNAFYDNALSAVTVSLALQGSAQNTLGAGTDTLIGIENLYGSPFGDTLTGDGGSNTISGNGGADTIAGGGGNDYLLGGSGDDSLSGEAGDDVLQGGPGNDVLDGGAGVDNAFYDDAASGVTVSLAIAGPQNTLGAGTDTLSNIENLYGSAFGDTLTGDANANTISGAGGSDTIDGGGGNDVLFGGPGDDSLQGGAGDDILHGGAGNDTLDGGTGVDNAFYDDAASGVTVSLAVAGPQNTLGAGTDTLANIENLYGSAFADTLTGDGGANSISGNGGADTIDGGGGADVLYGGAGADNLTGGAGADIFLYMALSDSPVGGSDLITDFASGDLIDLKPIDADPATPGDQAFQLGDGTHAGDIVVQAFDAAHNRTVVDIYTAPGAVSAEIWLTGDHSGLTAADFVL